MRYKIRRFSLSAVLCLIVALLCPAWVGAVSEFTDVPSSHWAHDAIASMAGIHLVSGVAENRFAPEGTVTNAQWIAMLSRQFFGTQDGETWYAPHLAAAAQAGVLDGTSVGADNSVINEPICRYDMAQMLYNLLRPKEAEPEEAEPEETEHTEPPEEEKPPLLPGPGIPDWEEVPASYQAALSACYQSGLLSGVDEAGNFRGERSMTRAQAAEVLRRLIREKTGAQPAVPQPDAVSRVNLLLANMAADAVDYIWVRSDRVTPVTMAESRLTSSFPRRGGSSKSGADNLAGWQELHNGNDFVTDVRDEEACWQVALWGGTVEEAQFRTGYGWTVLINHGGGLYTRYAHMGFGRAASSGGYPRWWDAVIQKEMGGVASSLQVSVGDTVKAGQVLGLMGTTGNASGPHAHIELILSPGGYEYVAWRAGIANILMDHKSLADLTWYYGTEAGYGETANIYEILGETQD